MKVEINIFNFHFEGKYLYLVVYLVDKYNQEFILRKSKGETFKHLFLSSFISSTCIFILSPWWHVQSGIVDSLSCHCFCYCPSQHLMCPLKNNFVTVNNISFTRIGNQLATTYNLFLKLDQGTSRAGKTLSICFVLGSPEIQSSR